MKNLFSYLLTAGLVLSLSPARAQGGPGDGGAPIENAPTGVPVDGGASLLLAGGVAYGLRKLRQRKAR